jgi:hypothetical protein
VSVQVRIPGTGIAVGERCGDESFGVDLGDTARAGAGEGGLILQPLQDVGHRGIVGGFDLFGDAQRGDGPQCGHRFHRRKGQVVPGDGGGARAGVAGDESRQFAVIGGRAAVLLGEQVRRHPRTDLGTQLRGDGGIPMRADVGVVVAEGDGQSSGQFRLAVVDLELPS